MKKIQYHFWFSYITVSEKKISIIGMVVGALFVLVGCLSIFGALGGEPVYATGANSIYDSGYAEFGADYYTYSVNNAAEAAGAANAAAANARQISGFLKLFCGLTSILFGLMVICGFGIVLFSCAQASEPTPIDSISSSTAEIDTPVETAADNFELSEKSTL